MGQLVYTMITMPDDDVVRKAKLVRNMNHAVWEDTVGLMQEVEPNKTVAQLIEQLFLIYLKKARKVKEQRESN